MVKNPKSKRDLFNNLRQRIGLGYTYVFPTGTKLNLWLWGNKVAHTLNELHIFEDGSIMISTTADGDDQYDRLNEFSWSEIRDISRIVESNISKQKCLVEDSIWV